MRPAFTQDYVDSTPPATALQNSGENQNSRKNKNTKKQKNPKMEESSSDQKNKK